MPVLRQRADERRQRAQMPTVRDQAVRGRAGAVNRKRGSRSGVSTRVAQDMAARLARVRALWFAVNNDPRGPAEAFASEFYFAVGELLEGRSIRDLTLRTIDRERILAHVEE